MDAIEKVKSALRRLDLSDTTQAVYLSLLTDGQATARTLALRTGITRPSVYDQIKILKKISLVNELDIENKAHYAASDLKYLSALLEDKIDHLAQSRDFLESALPSLRDSLETVDPKVRFFYGEDGVKQLLKDIMWHGNETLFVLWPHHEMSEVFDEKFLRWFDSRRATRDLAIHSLWSGKTKLTSQTLFTAHEKDVRHTIKIEPQMGYVIYGNKVAYISSAKESFGYIIESIEHRDLMKLQFETLVKLSR